jgi:hypothetical protein
VQVVVERVHNGAFGRRMGGADPAELATDVRSLLDGEALTARRLALALIERGIGVDVEAISNAANTYVPLVQLPPRGVWGRGGQVRYATLEAWTGRELEAEPSIEDVVLRYLRAFGPASVMDMQNWSGLTKLSEPFERLRERLVTFRDEDGRELFDLPDAPRPGADVPAPPRFLGEFDNVLLGHADRRRIVPAGVQWTGRFNNLLVDGMLRGTWWIDRGERTLAIRPFDEISRDEVAEEARRMADLAGLRAVRFE